MGVKTSTGQRRAAKVRARRGRARVPDRTRGLRRRDRSEDRPPHRPSELHPLEVLEEVDPDRPDEDVLRIALELAVVRTIDTGSPDVAEDVAGRIGRLGTEYGEAVELEYLDYLDGMTPVDPTLFGWDELALDVLVGWLGAARHREDAAAVAEDVLRWVEHRLGRSGQSLEQQAILLGGPGALRPLDLGQCLRHDLVAVRIWLVAGLVAVTGNTVPDALVHLGRRADTVVPGVDTPPRSGEQRRRPTTRASGETVGPDG
ncbi:hypothetical protein [Actinomycetospora atypica]|uniref:Uncharacterized protein n=1 Tax=Actinomycetospora atypica TaxID=1290095 RepID=A0ABV9YP96_9PSEU